MVRTVMSISKVFTELLCFTNDEVVMLIFREAVRERDDDRYTSLETRGFIIFANMRIKYCCNASKHLYESYYTDQSGSGMPIFVERQRGHGLDSGFSIFFRS